MADTAHRIIFWFLEPYRIVGWRRHSSKFFCEPTVLFGVMTLKIISVLISVKCLIIGFIQCRINNNVHKNDNYEVADKNNVTTKMIF